MLSPSGLKDRLFYGWVMVISFLIIGTTLWGIRLSFGVFFKSIENEFGLTRAATSAVFSTYMILGSLFGILVGWALDRYGPRIITIAIGLFAGFSLLLTSQVNSTWQLFITYSLLFAIGSGGVFVLTMSTIMKWFDKKRGLALGITSSGASLGMMVMAPFATFLIANFGWRMAYIVLGVIAWLVVVPLSLLCKRDPHEIGALPDGVKSDSLDGRLEKPKNNQEDSLQSAGLLLLQLFRIRRFWLFMFIFLLAATSRFLIFTHLVPHITDIGFSAAQAAAVFSLMGGTAMVGRVLMGTVSDKIGRKLTFITCSLVETGAMVWLLWSQDLWMLYLFAAVYGFAFGGSTPAMIALVGDTFGLSNIGKILGVLEFGFGVGAAIGPTMGGLIFDVNNSYFMAFSLGAVIVFARTLLIALIGRERILENGQSR